MLSSWGEDFYFPFMDEDDHSIGFIYRKPRVEIAPYWRESRTIACDEGSYPTVPQYQTTISECVNLEGVREVYHFPIYYRAYYSRADQRIHTPPPQCITTYIAHLKASLRFPLHPLFMDICKYYDIQLGQLMPNVIQTTVVFIMACRA